MLLSRPNYHWLPVGSLLLAATLWGVFWYPLRLFADAGLHGLWTSFLIYAGTLPLAVYLLRGRLGEFSLAPINLIILALASGWCNTAFILAMLDGHVVRVLLLFYLAPVWTVILGYLFLHEHPDRQGMLVILFAFVGAMVMLWEPSAGMPLPGNQADWLALSSGFAFAVTNVCVRKAQQVSVAIKMVSAWSGSALVSGVLLIAMGITLSTNDTAPVGYALLYGAVVMVVMTMSVQFGVTHMPVHRSAVILLFELVVGAVSAYLLTSEKVLLQEWIGGGLVVIAAYLSAQNEINGIKSGT